MENNILLDGIIELTQKKDMIWRKSFFNNYTELYSVTYPILNTKIKININLSIKKTNKNDLLSIYIIKRCHFPYKNINKSDVDNNLFDKLIQVIKEQIKEQVN
jgi:hypothetical protein